MNRIVGKSQHSMELELCSMEPVKENGGGATPGGEHIPFNPERKRRLHERKKAEEQESSSESFERFALSKSFETLLANGFRHAGRAWSFQAW